MFAKLIWLSLLMQALWSHAQSEPIDFLVPEVASSVGESIEAQVNLGRLDTRFGRVSVVLADEESFAAFGVRRYQIFDALFLDLRDNAAGEFVLGIFSNQPVYEPSLRFVVEVEDGTGLRQIPIELLLPTDDAAGQERRLLLSRPNDTLWRIANRTKDDSVTNDQQMLAVQRLNPQAFRASNINGLKPWNMLTLPLFEEAVTISRVRAAEDVATQNSRWRSEQMLDRAVSLPEPAPVQDYGDVRIIAVEEPSADSEETVLGVEEESSEEGFDALESKDSEPAFASEALSGAGEFEAAVDEMPSEATAAAAAPTTPQANTVSDVDPAVDVFDLEKLEAQVREEEAGAFAQLLDRAMTSSGVGILAAILLAAAILLLLLRRRAAQQEQVLDDVLGNGDESEEVTPQKDPEPEGVTDLDEADEDVYTTRLKLAEAYLEMGDEDGAEGMLEEVIADGSPNQQEVARRILARLDAERTAQRPENGDD